MKILITSDLHFESLIINFRDKCLEFIENSIKVHKPSAFIIAGDTVDSHNLKSGSDSYMSLMVFIKTVAKICKENGVEFIILRGTKGHDGEIVKNIHVALRNTDIFEFTYIDTPTMYKINGESFLFIPEMYLPTIKEFENMMTELTKDSLPSVIIFHGMFDFAIPIAQVNSNYNLSRSVVINSSVFRNYFKLCAVGGHVHMQLKNKDIIYTDSMINSIGNTDMNKGLGLLNIKGPDSYEYSTIPNPANIIHKIHYIDFVNQSLIEIDGQVTELSKNYDINYVIFNAKINSRPEVLNNYTSFIRKFNPKYIKKIILEDNIGSNDNSSIDKKYNIFNYKNRNNITIDDTISMIMSISESKYGKKLKQEIVTKSLKENYRSY